jgi:predicted amidophosphoribosyltransferase
MILDGWGAAAGDLLLGSRCPGCSTAAWGLCPVCRDLVASHRPALTRPDPCPAGFPRTVTSAPYDSVLRGAISAHKERQALGLTPYLGERLAMSVTALLSLEPDRLPGRRIGVVPVPSATAAVRARGFDATWALARVAARRLAGRHALVATRVLAQRRGVGDQAGRTAAERAANLRHGLVLRRVRPPELVVLVDDLVTTGASLTEAARVLAAAGVEVLGAATVAATVRLRRPREGGVALEIGHPEG